MLRIDFHIHTLPSPNKQENFSFSLEKLKEYVSKNGINAIAITNHNTFSKNDYLNIKRALSIEVYPGIEVDLESGHILVITEYSNISNFEMCCQKVETIVNSSKKLNTEEFFSIFETREEFLFIPHYKKKPAITRDVIDKFGKDIFCGEVDNFSKFYRLYKEDGELTPVLFSDCRFEQRSPLPLRSTFIDTSINSLASIKETLRDKEKVFLTKNKSRDTFAVLDDGTEASTGLNVIVGQRSSGKTYTLNRIFDAFNNEFCEKSVKYIKQFELIETGGESKEKEKFEKLLSDKGSIFRNDYLSSFKKIVDYVQTIDIESKLNNASNYLSSLLVFASDADKHDVFAKVPLFSDQPFDKPSTNKIVGLIASAKELLNPGAYSQIIEKHIERNNLVALLNELINEYKKEAKRIQVINYTNTILDVVKKALTVESNQDSIPSFDLLELVKEKREIACFNKLVEILKNEKDIKRVPNGKFFILAKRSPFLNATGLQKEFKSHASFSISFSYYDNPYMFLRSLKQQRTVPENELYRCFVKIDYEALNENGFAVSGGERAEYVLEDKLSDANDYEMLLIDEPESSFDNIFLKSSINTRIKELSQKMPVFVSTHNSIVGASIRANFILLTTKEIIDNQVTFKVYSGEMVGKELKTVYGDTTKNFDTQMNCLEGGKESYKDRGLSYESIKD